MELPIESPLSNIDSRILTLYNRSQIEAELELLQFKYAYPICGQVSMVNRELEICVNKAEEGTHHINSGRCSKHDGQSIGATISPYGQHLKGYASLQQIYEELRSSGAQFKSLKDEITILRGLLVTQLTRLNSKEVETEKHNEVCRNIIGLCESIRKMVTAISEVEKAEAMGITPESIGTFLRQVQSILDQEITNIDHKMRIFDRIATETSWQKAA